MMELLSKDMLADLAINILNIIVLFLVTKKLLYKPVKKYLDKRKSEVQAEFDEAQRLKEAAIAEKAEYDEVILNSDKKLEEALALAQEKARDEAQKIIAAAKVKADGIVENAEKEAENERRQLLKAEKEDIIDAALNISSRILLREVTDADNRAIIDAFFDDGV